MAGSGASDFRAFPSCRWLAPALHGAHCDVGHGKLLVWKSLTRRFQSVNVPPLRPTRLKSPLGSHRVFVVGYLIDCKIGLCDIQSAEIQVCQITQIRVCQISMSDLQVCQISARVCQIFDTRRFLVSKAFFK